MIAVPVPHTALLIADALAERGLAIVPCFLDVLAVTRLRAHAEALARSGVLRSAGVGRGDARTESASIRGDRILWLDPASADPSEVAYFRAMHQLRQVLNRELMLGLVELDAHYALYPPGARYARHRDRFRDDDRRTLSCVLYLNEGWAADDGGALRLYTSHGERDVLPSAGTFVAFRSEAFEHEVLPARQARLSITGWWLRRA